MKKPKWDVELGRLLWLEGKTDGEIADEFGIPTCTVTSYRTRHWQKELIRKEDAPAELPKTSETITPPENFKEEYPVENEKTSEKKKPINPYEVLEAATGSMRGIHAICTAEAILCLWNWTSREDLEKAKAAIEYLLKREEVK